MRVRRCRLEIRLLLERSDRLGVFSPCVCVLFCIIILQVWLESRGALSLVSMHPWDHLDVPQHSWDMRNRIVLPVVRAV